MKTLATASRDQSRSGASESNGSRYHVQLPDLPATWSYQRFDKILDVQGGSQPPKSTFVYEPTPGYVQLLQIRDFGERGVPTFVREDSVTKRCTEDDILIARYGASLGRIVTGESGAYNVALAKVIYDKDQFFNRYLFYLLKTPFFQTPIHMISRSAQNGFNKGDLSDIILPVAPLPEQRRIVAEIEKQFTRLEAGVAALRRVQANLKRYRAAVLKAACEGQLVPTEAELHKVAAASRRSAGGKQSRDGSATFETGEQLLQRILAERRKNWEASNPKSKIGNRKYREPAGPVTANLPEFPKGWTVASLEQLTSAARPICYGILMPKENVANGVLFVKVKDMKGDKIDLAGLHRTTPEIAARYARASLRTGDLLLAIRGTYGRVAEVPKELDGGNITQDTARLDVSDLVDHRYVAMCLRNPDCQNYFKRVARGVAVKGVNIGDVRPTPIPLPPLAEQTRIVAEVERRLSVVEELESVVSANLQRATRLRQSILQKAFTGNL